DLPARAFLVTSFVLGTALVAFGHSGPGTGSLGGAERSALDGPLVAFRNVVKFDVVLRLPLALGLSHACTILLARLRPPDGAGRPAHPARRARARRPGGARGASPAGWRLAAGGAAALAVAAVLGSAWPLWSGQAEAAGTFTGIPSWWDEAARWLAAHDGDGGRALLLPASQHPDYVWGLPTDEPFQVLATVPWAVRDAVPLGGAGEARLLDAVDAVVGSGQGSPGLAAYLARAGVQWLVVRNDLDRGRENGAISTPLVVQGALDGSPGIRPVASFGPLLGPGSLGPTVLEGGTPLALPAVEIFEVGGAVRQVVSYPVAGTLRVSGGPESLLELASLGLLPPGSATVMAADPAPAGTDPAAEHAVVTDGYRHQEVDFGRASNNVSATLLPGEAWSLPRAVHDYLIGTGAGHQTTALLDGVAAVEASSSASSAGAVRDFDSEYSPAAAFEQIPGDGWVNGSERAVGQWVEERFLGDRPVRAVTIATPELPGTGSQVSEVRVTTARGSNVLLLPAGTAPHRFELPAGRSGPTPWLRVTILAVRGGGRGGAAALSVGVPGIAPAQESLRVPDDVAAGAGAPLFVFGAEPGQDDGCVALSDPPTDVCAPTLLAGTEDSPGLDRTFSLARAARYRVEVEAVARAGAALGNALPTAGGLRVSASSQRAPDPSDDPQTLFEGDPQSGWVASTTDPDPSLTVVLPHRAVVRAVELERAATLRASTPLSIELRRAGAGAGAAETATVRSGIAVLAHPLAGTAFVLSFPRVQWRVDVTDRGAGNLPVGLSSLRLVARGISTSAPALDSSVSLACGRGPRLELDGRRWPTAVRGTLGAVLAKAPLQVVPCGMAGSVLDLAPGTHHLRAMQNAAVTPDAVVLSPLTPPPAAASPAPAATSPAPAPAAAPTGLAPPAPALRSRSLRVLSWGDEARAVRIGPGPASFVVVRENANAGWAATLDGRRLAPGVVDGWQQAFVVPAGSGGVVELGYQPNGPFRDALLAGAVAAAVLVVLACVPDRRRRRRSRVGGASGDLPAGPRPASEVADRVAAAGGAPHGRTRLGAAIAA
ncbi:MAG TPA: alpha-(1-_3)-arabinofuranosyltransferase family protein, partial [Acidimicrobiales bacterium]|nr:alpha-(1->3)-arabinofuranosyltransferase family protein [Acidimicrobiales bacterium]